MKIDGWAVKEAVKCTCRLTMLIAFAGGGAVGLLIGIAKLMQYSHIAGVASIAALLFISLVVFYYFEITRISCDY